MAILTGILIVALVIAVLWLWNKLQEEAATPKDNKRRAFSNDEKIKIAWKHYEKHGAGCAHCSGDEDLDFDHIKPLARGGHNGQDNMQILCGRCNSKKGAKLEL